jgi:tRNA-dihydrouridine synthase
MSKIGSKLPAPRRFLSKQTNSFFDEVGKPRFISAPMVDHSEQAFRLLLRSYGVDMTFTQMIHSKSFVTSPGFREHEKDWGNYSRKNNSKIKEQNHEDNELFAKQHDNPLVVQLNGHEGKYLTEAGRIIVEEKGVVSAIDLNLGCPQQIAKRGNYGAHLLNTKDREGLLSLIKEMVREIPLPVSVKIRKLSCRGIVDSEKETIDFCQRLEGLGVSMITLHGRVLEQSKSFTGPADWETIRRVKKAVRSIPIIANGGISSYEDVETCLSYTGVDGVMSSEAILENPKLFVIKDSKEYRENYLFHQFSSTKDYLSLISRFPPKDGAVIRAHLFKLLHAFIHARKNIDLRLRLVQSTEVDHFLAITQELEERLKPYLQSGDRGKAVHDEYDLGFGWYNRHRDERSTEKKMPPPKNGIPYPLDLPYHVIVDIQRMKQVISMK